jgi:hypothetical protein
VVKKNLHALLQKEGGEGKDDDDYDYEDDDDNDRSN